MPPENGARKNAELWLEYALSDLAMAKTPLPAGAKYTQLLFHAQQAAEKAIKAVLILNGVDFPYTHNIQRLIELLPPAYIIEPALLSATALTEYAVLTRYPTEIAPVEEEHYQRLIDVAEQVVKWAKGILSEV